MGRSFLRRHAHLVVLVVFALVYLPFLGHGGLVDPWETHYAEVAREMLVRHDYVSPWWGHEGWFRSKPVLLFWLEALTMRFDGQSEWAVRLPGFAFLAVGIVLLHHGVAHVFRWRAGLLTALVFGTSAGVVLLGHQALTDGPLIGSVAASLGLLLRAAEENPWAEVRRHRLHVRGHEITLHGGHLVAVFVALIVVPQLVILATQGHVFFAGDPLACHLPGQPRCAAVAFAHPRLGPMLQIAMFAPLGLLAIVTVAEETRTARVLSAAAWTFACLGAMAKGPVALAIPVAAILAHLAARRSLRVFAGFVPVTALGLAVALICPWYVALFARHGKPWLDELVVRNMLGRTLEHLHDTNAGESVGLIYYVRQLAFATFPWSGIVAIVVLGSPAALLCGARSRRGRGRIFLYGAGVFAFALVSAMKTKFHHYVLIAVPPSAALAGIWLEHALAMSERGRWRHARMATLALIAASITAYVARDVALDGAIPMKILTYRYSREWIHAAKLGTLLGAIGVAAASATAALAFRRFRHVAVTVTGICAFASAVILGDLYVVRAGTDGGQRDLIRAYYTSSGIMPAPLAAYQMNWKGEYFYSGNDLAVFVSSGAPMKAWLEGKHVVYFVTEKGRVEGLRRELGASTKDFEILTDDETAAEYRLVRATL